MAGLRVRRKTRGMKQREVPALGGILVEVSRGARTDSLSNVITSPPPLILVIVGLFAGVILLLLQGNRSKDSTPET